MTAATPGQPGCGCTVCAATGSPHGVPQPAPAEELRGYVRELIGIIVAGTASHPGIYARVRHIAEQAQIEPPAIIAVTRTEKGAPELAADASEARGYREALHRARETLDEGGTIGRRLSVTRSIVNAALEGK